MSKISATQRAALEAAGFTIAKSGNTVLNKDGKSVGGFNANGQIFSGNSKVRDILKTKDEPKKATSTKSAPTKSKPKAAPKPAAKEDKKTNTGNVKNAPNKRPPEDKKTNTGRMKDGLSNTEKAALTAAGVGAAAMARKGLGMEPKNPPRKPVQAKPYNPNYGKSRAVSVARGRGRGMAYDVTRGVGGGGGEMTLDDFSRARDPLMLNFAKGGMVSKKKSCAKCKGGKCTCK